MKNKYEIRGDITAIFIDRRGGSVEEAIISTSKLGRAKDFPNKWCLNGNGYVSGFCPNNRENRTEWILHRHIIDAPTDKLVDHRDMNRLNCTDGNLRVTDHSGNAQNVLARITSKSGIRGVYPHKNNRWIANLMIKGKRYYLGIFDSVEEAEGAVKRARAELMPYSQEAMEG